MDKRARVIQDGVWCAKNLNGTLHHDADITHAFRVLCEAGLPRHADRPKNWDHLLALYAVLADGWRDDPVLDAGACEGSSAFLPALAECGYTSLTGCNIDFALGLGQHTSTNGVRYQHGDVTQLPFPTNTFRFVSCLSVIEHGVPLHPFMCEMRRVIKPGGMLFVSTDYWPDKIDAGGQTAFGAPVNVFSRDEITKLLYWAEMENFTLDGTPDLSVYEPTVEWLGMNYTFLNLLFRRR